MAASSVAGSRLPPIFFLYRLHMLIGIFEIGPMNDHPMKRSIEPGPKRFCGIEAVIAKELGMMLFFQLPPGVKIYEYPSLLRIELYQLNRPAATFSKLKIKLRACSCGEVYFTPCVPSLSAIFPDGVYLFTSDNF